VDLRLVWQISQAEARTLLTGVDELLGEGQTDPTA
jgi:hypothetical protein